MARQTLDFELHDRWMLIAYGAGAPDPKEFEEYAQAIAVNAATLEGVIVDGTSGIGPDLMQRDALLRAYGGRKVRVAVFTRSSNMRGISTIFSWFLQTKVFDPDDRATAFDHVGLPERERATVHAKLGQLRLGLPLPKSAP
jgi:hypothetical protein